MNFYKWLGASFVAVSMPGLAVGDVVPWSENRPNSPTVLPADLATKQARELNPLATPRFYELFYDKNAGTVSVADPALEKASEYQLYKNINDPESGFHAKIVVNPETRHALMIMKGMDLPGRYEGTSESAFGKDVALPLDGIDGAWGTANYEGEISPQVLTAETEYLELLQDPNIASVEIVGYSIGSIPANYLSTVYGAQSTNIANLGVPDPNNKFSLWGVLNFNTQNDFPIIEGEFANNINANVTNIVASYDDIAGGFIGDVGTEYGTDIHLDSWYDFNIQGLGHVPGAYANIAEQNPETPSVDITSVSTHPQFDTFEPTMFAQLKPAEQTAMVDFDIP